MIGGIIGKTTQELWHISTKSSAMAKLEVTNCIYYFSWTENEAHNGTLCSGQGLCLTNCLLCMVKCKRTFADLIPYVFINNSDDSISMTRGTSSLEDYFYNLLIRRQLAVFQTTQQSSQHVRQAAFWKVWTLSSSGQREKMTAGWQNTNVGQREGRNHHAISHLLSPPSAT